MVVLTVPSLERVRWARFSLLPVAYCELRFWYAAMVETTFRADAAESAAGDRVSGGQCNAVSFAGRNADPTQQRIGVGTAAENKENRRLRLGRVAASKGTMRCKKDEERMKKKKRYTKTVCGGVDFDAASSRNRSAAPEAKGLEVGRTQRLGG